MSRYLLLLILNMPFIFAALLSSLTQYKLNKISRNKFTYQSLFWLLILFGLIFAETIYGFLLKNNFTDTDSLSLFDVVQITALVILFYIANRSRQKVEVIENRLRDFHQELSIMLSQNKK